MVSDEETTSHGFDGLFDLPLHLFNLSNGVVRWWLDGCSSKNNLKHLEWLLVVNDAINRNEQNHCIFLNKYVHFDSFLWC